MFGLLSGREIWLLSPNPLVARRSTSTGLGGSFRFESVPIGAATVYCRGCEVELIHHQWDGYERPVMVAAGEEKPVAFFGTSLLPRDESVRATFSITREDYQGWRHSWYPRVDSVRVYTATCRGTVTVPVGWIQAISMVSNWGGGPIGTSGRPTSYSISSSSGEMREPVPHIPVLMGATIGVGYLDHFGTPQTAAFARGETLVC
jgi:hypothetical protein